MAESKPAAYDAVAAACVRRRRRARQTPHEVDRAPRARSLRHRRQPGLAARDAAVPQAAPRAVVRPGRHDLAGGQPHVVDRPAALRLSLRPARAPLDPAGLRVRLGRRHRAARPGPGYPGVLALVVVMGLGVAAWHPEGYKTATGVAGNRKATALSWFSLGGNVGIALGPPLMTFLITRSGARGHARHAGAASWSACCSGRAADVHARGRAGEGRGRRPARGGEHARRDGPADPWSCRFAPGRRFGFTTFVPFYYVDTLKADPRIVGLLLFVFLGAGALGDRGGGTDRRPRRTAAVHEVGVAGGRCRSACSFCSRADRSRSSCSPSSAACSPRASRCRSCSASPTCRATPAWRRGSSWASPSAWAAPG